MKSGERPIMPQVERAQFSIITRRFSRSSLVRGMMNDRPSGSPVFGEMKVIAVASAGSHCMSYSAAIAWAPRARPGCVVTSLTRSPRSQTSRCWSRRRRSDSCRPCAPASRPPALIMTKVFGLNDAPVKQEGSRPAGHPCIATDGNRTPCSIHPARPPAGDQIR